eukprot:7172659-Prymnesium_polylepis.1
MSCGPSSPPPLQPAARAPKAPAAAEDKPKARMGGLAWPIRMDSGQAKGVNRPTPNGTVGGGCRKVSLPARAKEARAEIKE